MVTGFARLAIAAVPMVCLSCNSEETAAPTPSEPAAIRLKVPLEFTVEQRTTTVVPGSENRLSLTIDDITDNQVMVSLGTDTGETPIPMRSMSPRDHVTFTYAGTKCTLTLEQLDNALIGEDAASFTITAAGQNSPDEQAKIERLIEAVATLKGATFIRNGAEYSAIEAADHLRTKWDAASDSIKTAEQFIDEVASKSSLSGEAYQIRFADGKTVAASEFLDEKLEGLSTPH